MKEASADKSTIEGQGFVDVKVGVTTGSATATVCDVEQDVVPSSKVNVYVSVDVKFEAGA